MSKKKEERGRSYLHAPVPGKTVNTGAKIMPISQSEREYTQTRMSFSGIDRRGRTSGGMRDALNVSFSEYPCAKSMPKGERVSIAAIPDGLHYDYPESVHVFGDVMLVFYRKFLRLDTNEYEAYSLHVDYIKIAERMIAEMTEIPVTLESALEGADYEYDKAVDVEGDYTFTEFWVDGGPNDITAAYDKLKNISPDDVYPGSDAISEYKLGVCLADGTVAYEWEKGEYSISDKVLFDNKIYICKHASYKDTLPDASSDWEETTDSIVSHSYFHVNKKKVLEYKLINTIDVTGSNPFDFIVEYKPGKHLDKYDVFNTDRSVVAFNVADIDGQVNIEALEYKTQYWVYPERIYFEIKDDLLTFDKDFISDDERKLIPKLTTAIAHEGRIYGGTSEGTLYVSTYNDPTGFDFDKNAWMTHTQVDGGHKGGFNSIVSFGGRVLAFSPSRIYSIYSAGGDFISQKIADIGCIDGRSVCATDGAVFFASYDGIYVYDGTSIDKISSKLGELRLKSAVSAYCSGKYYFCSKEISDGIYVFDILTGALSRISDQGDICNISSFGHDVYAFCKNGYIMRLESEYNTEYGEFLIETEEFIGDTLKNRRIKEINLIIEADGEADVELNVVHNTGNDAVSLIPLRTKHFSHSGRELEKLTARLNLPSFFVERLRISGNGKVILHALDVTHTYF